MRGFTGVCVCVWGKEQEERCRENMSFQLSAFSQLIEIVCVNVPLKATIINMCGCGLRGTLPVGLSFNTETQPHHKLWIKQLKHIRQHDQHRGGDTLTEPWSQRALSSSCPGKAHDVITCKQCYRTDERRVNEYFLGRKRCEIGRWISDIKVEVKEHTHRHTLCFLILTITRPSEIYVHIQLRLRALFLS